MNSLLERLLKDYGVYKSDEAYYNELISTCSNDLKKIKELILKDIKDSWSNYNIDWFIAYANKRKFDEVLALIRRYRLELNPIVVQNITDQCPKIANHLEKLLSTKEKWLEEDFEKEFQSNTLFDIVYNYAIILNKIDLGETVNKSVAEVNYDAYIGDSTKMYIREIQSLQEFDKNHDRIVKYNEYKKLAKVTTDPELIKKYEKEAEKYRKLIIEGNLCLAIPTASKYRNNGVDLLDLIQEGSIGIMTALERFDPNRSFSFSTYATWWIKQTITRYVMDNSRTIRVPVHLHEYYNRFKTFTENFMRINFREPTVDELSEKFALPREKVNHILKSFDSLVSLDAPIKTSQNEDSDEVYAFVADTYDYDEDIFKSDYVNKILTGLKPQQEFVMRMRFGIPDGKDPRFERDHTLEEVGNALGVTRERVRQIEAKVIKRFRDKENITVAYYPNKKNCTFWEFFDGIDRATVYEKMQYLSDKDLAKLYSKYGKDLDDFVYFEPGKNAKVLAVIHKIKRMLNNPLYRPQYYNALDNRFEARVIYNYDDESLIELINLDKETIVGKLKEESVSLELVKRVFGENLDNKPNFNNIKSDEMGYLNSVIHHLKTNDIVENLITLREVLMCNDEEYEKAINKATPGSKYYKKLFDIFGETLEDKGDFYLLNPSDYLSYLNALIAMKGKIDRVRTTKLYYSTKTLSARLGKTEDEFKELLESMNKDSKMYNIIQKYLRRETLSYTEKTLFDHWIIENKRKKAIRRYTKEETYYDVILKKLCITESEFRIIYNTIDPNVRIYDVLTKALNNATLNDEDVYILRAWLNIKIRNPKFTELDKIPNTKKAKKVLEELRFTEDELLNYLSNTSVNSLRYNSIVKTLKEEKLDAKEARAYYTWRSIIKKIYQESMEILLSNEHELVNTNLDIGYFKGLICNLDEQTRKVMELRLGLYDGTIYSVSEISEMFNISNDLVNEYIENGFSYINSLEKENTLSIVRK